MFIFLACVSFLSIIAMVLEIEQEAKSDLPSVLGFDSILVFFFRTELVASSWFN